VIRRARPQDAQAIAELQVRGWRRAFLDVVDEEEMPTVARRRARWDDKLAGDHGSWVLEEDGRVAGVLSIGRSRDEDAGAATGEVGLVSVDPPAQGAGVGTALLAEGERLLREAGFAEATLWVVAGDGLARRFYERRGWAPDGTQAVWRGAPSARYRKALA
jgi:GNAT superfamily N-acetyltransferase